MQLLKQPLRLTNIVINHLNGKVMVKHIVLFKLKDEAPADEKLAAMNSFKAAIEALPAKISVIRKIEVGLNLSLIHISEPTRH